MLSQQQPPGGRPFVDLYETLGVRPEATNAEIQEAYFQKVVKELPIDQLEKAIQVAVAERDRRTTNMS